MHNPFDIKIVNQAEDEKILQVWHHHPITLIKPGLKVAAFLAVPFLLLIFTNLAMFTHPILFAIFLLILIICVTYAAYEWISWYGDVYVLTTYRVIDIQQRGFFRRAFSEAGIDKIQDVNYEINGFLQTVLGYGHVLVHTAGPAGTITFEDINDPAEQVLYLLQQQKENKVKEDQPLTAEDLIKLLTKHHDEINELAEKQKRAKEEVVDEKIEEIKKDLQKKHRKKKPKKQTRVL